MALPTPQTDESQDAFIARCLQDPAIQEITGKTAEETQQRRVAAGVRRWRESKGAGGAEVKAITVEIKDADKGEVEAVFATFDVKDKDGDITLPGAFEEGAEVLISAYGHSSWGGQLPVGKGVIKTTAKDARLVGKFFLNTTAGREHFAVIKELGAQQEWSYGFDVKGTGEVTPEMEQNGVWRVLTALKVHEVSPVLLGAGIDTRTVATKDGTEAADAAAAAAAARATEQAAAEAKTKAEAERQALAQQRDEAYRVAARLGP